MIVRGFLITALPLIILLPFAGARYPGIGQLTAWHFVAVLFTWGVVSLILKIILWKLADGSQGDPD